MKRNFEAASYDPSLQPFVHDFTNPDFQRLTFEDLPLQEWPAQWHPSAAFPTPQSALTNEFRRIADAEHSFGEPAYYRLGNPNLPVGPYREAYLKTAELNPTLVVSSATGSGKSSQLGIYHLEDGTPRIFVTQPRKVAARNLMEYARQTLGPKYARLAGYITGDEEDSDCPPEARLIYVVERVLFNDMNRGNLRPGDRLILDEAHERSMPMDFMLGLVEDIREDIPEIGVTISSATIDTDFFAKHMANRNTGEPAPVMILPGRTYP
ncbi:MAG TPA: DEAD/DEAH box helicase, partial [Candidatus Saccharimonadales bacterium]|nr:DEAD/DEAH box helicase [Candidatus Saccharimonadales bacterium]